MLVFDHFKNELYITQNSIGSPEESDKDLQMFVGLLRRKSHPGFKFNKQGIETSGISNDKFKEYVKKGVAHCKRGDVFQIFVLMI